MDSSIVASKRAHPPTVVAIPAMDEAERIVACLDALDRQQTPPDEVVVLCNNCTDDTAAIARALAPGLCFALHVVTRSLPPHQANAGHARRLAMELAARRAGPHGVLLTSDADSVVPPDWIRRNLAGLLGGADLVCGRAVVEGIEAEMIPAHLHADDALERKLIALVDEMAWMLDPDPHDPPPRHTEASGASLAVRVSAFDRVGGIPAIASGEDRAFVEALGRIDARIRHDPRIQVVVSGRVVGRAAGGMADAIRRRMVQQDEFTDAEVEPAANALRRLTLRARARAVWSHGCPDPRLAVDLALDAKWLASVLANTFFGVAWAAIEAESPVLVRQPVRFVDLPAEIAAASRLLSQPALEKTVPPTERPQSAPSQTTLPQMTLPHTTLPQKTLPQMTLPQTTLPHTAPSHTAPSHMMLAQTTLPQTTVPETMPLATPAYTAPSASTPPEKMAPERMPPESIAAE